MNENTHDYVRSAIEILKDGVHDATRRGDYDSAERILVQLRGLETLTTTQKPVEGRNEVTATELLREIMNEMYYTDTDTDKRHLPHGGLGTTSGEFDNRWLPKVKTLLGIP